MPLPFQKDDPRMDENVRFWNKVIMPTRGCWEWQGSLDGTGYGRLGWRGKMAGAHRVSYGMFYGEIPENILVLHKCDNPKCVKPDHLYLGGHRENMIDRELRGRGVGKLSPRDIRDIRSRNAAGESQASLRKEYGISDGHISDIIRRRKWAWVD